MSVEDLMGKIVLVDRVFQRDVERVSNNLHTKRWHTVDATGRPGWVIGERWIQDGTSGYEYEYGNVWTAKSAHHCILVAYWPTMTPVRVPDGGFRMAHETIRPFPSSCTNAPWPQSARDFLRKEMSEWPRDNKGRWVKK